MADWHNAASLKAQWSSAPAEPLSTELLDVAKAQVLSRGTLVYTVDPEVEGDQIPAQYRMAQALYARALWERQHADNAGDANVLGGEYPLPVSGSVMSSTILDLISPKVPRVG